MIDYQLVRSKRKTLAIQVTREGKVVVRAPLFSTDRQIITQTTIVMTVTIQKTFEPYAK